MKKLFVALLLLLTVTTGHAAVNDVIANGGVVYQWSSQELAYWAVGWDQTSHIQSLHVLAEVDGYDVIGITSGAFEDNADIVYVKIDEGITRIGQNAFCRCMNMETIVMPEGLEVIEEEAFAFCSKLTSVTIPSTVREIQSHAFTGCTGVADVYFLTTDSAFLNGPSWGWWDGTYHTAPQTAGGLEFNTNEHTTIHVPNGMLEQYTNCGKFEAWLNAMQEDDNCYPLWWIVNYGIVGREYTVSDDLLGIHVDVNNNLYAKDDNHWLMPDKAYNGEVDYMKSTGLLSERGNVYDQSNWVVLQNVDNPHDFVHVNLQGLSVKGILRDKHNPVIELSAQPVKGAKHDYILNTYIAASLMSRTQTVTNGSTFAFVRPKPQELATFDWTIYGGEMDFYVPAPDAQQGINVHAIKGGFTICDDLYEQATMPAMVEGGYYPFEAIIRAKNAEEDNGRMTHIKKAESSVQVPYRESGVTNRFDVYPLLLPDAPIITAINTVVADPSKAGTTYDLQGRRVENPSHGIYIQDGKVTIVR